VKRRLELLLGEVFPMPIFVPVALGGIALVALGLGVKRALEELSPPPSFGEGTRAHEAQARHQQAVAALRAARLRVKERMQAYAELQERARSESAEPFHALLSRLERWEQAKSAEVLTPGGHAALSDLPLHPAPRSARQAWALRGMGEEASPSMLQVLEWLERGWLAEDSPPVLVDGVSLYTAAACAPPLTDETQAVRAYAAATEALGRAVSFLDSVQARLEVLHTKVATLHARAHAQLEYLDAASFEEAHPEPRERLRRLGHLMGALAEALRVPVLEFSGGLAPMPAPLAD
jgi:hypothetical protein